MLEVMALGAAALIVLAVLGVAGAWGMSRLLDIANSRNTGRFRAVLDQIEDDPFSAAIYYGMRWIGICILIGWLFSKPV